MERTNKRAHRLSLQASFFHRSPSSPASLGPSEASPRHSCVSSIEQDSISESLKIPKRKWADVIADLPHDPGTQSILLENSDSTNGSALEDDIVLEGKLRKAGKSKGKDRLRTRYFYLTRKFFSYHLNANGPAKGRLYFEDIVGLVSRDVFYFRPQPGLEWEIEHAKQHELRRTDFIIVTSKVGFERGRQYFIRAASTDERKLWTSSIRDMMQFYATHSVKKSSGLTTFRRRVRWLYFGDMCQVIVASFIMLNFLVNIVEAQYSNLDPSDPISIALGNVDTAFTALFTAELVVNMFGTLIWEYARDLWNWFDLIVVSVSLLSLGMTNMPGASTLRLLRCFRVFRLFKRIKSLRQLIVALVASIPPMMNAFVLVCLVAAIYSILGATFFNRAAPDYFGNFLLALFFMFQTMTGDAWSDPARDLFVSTGYPAAVAVFFVSFQLTLNLVLLNVVIAVLLDEFTKAGERTSKPKDNVTTNEYGALDCLCEPLLPHANRRTLDLRLAELFRHVIFEARGPTAGAEAFTLSGLSAELTYEELHDGLRRLGFLPPIEFTRNDWERMVVTRNLLADRTSDADQAIGFRSFKLMIKHAIWNYLLNDLHQITEAGDEDLAWDAQKIALAFSSLKGVLMEDVCPSNVKGGEAAHLALLNQIVAGLDGARKKLDSVEKELGSVASTASGRGAPAKQVQISGLPDVPITNSDSDPVMAQNLNPTDQSKPRKLPSIRQVKIEEGISSAAALRRRLAERLQREGGPLMDDDDVPPVARSLDPLFQSERIESSIIPSQEFEGPLPSTVKAQYWTSSEGTGERKDVERPLPATSKKPPTTLSLGQRKTLSSNGVSVMKHVNEALGEPEYAGVANFSVPLDTAGYENQESSANIEFVKGRKTTYQQIAGTKIDQQHLSINEVQPKTSTKPVSVSAKLLGAKMDKEMIAEDPDFQPLLPAVTPPETSVPTSFKDRLTGKADLSEASGNPSVPPPKPTPAASLPVRSSSSIRGLPPPAAIASPTATPMPFAPAVAATSSTPASSLLSPMAMLMTPFGGIGIFPPDSVPGIHAVTSASASSSGAPSAPAPAGVVANPVAPDIFGALLAPWGGQSAVTGQSRPARPEAQAPAGIFDGFLDGLTALGGTLAGLGGGAGGPSTQTPALAAGLMAAATHQGTGPMLSKRLMGQ